MPTPNEITLAEFADAVVRMGQDFLAEKRIDASKLDWNAIRVEFTGILDESLYRKTLDPHVIAGSDGAAFVGELIDVLEDALEDAKIEIPNDERDDDEDAAIIYGCDYGELSDAVFDLLERADCIDYSI